MVWLPLESRWPRLHSCVFPEPRHDIGKRKGFTLTGLAGLDFCFTCSNSARSDDHLPGKADKVSGRKLSARALVRVVIKNVEARIGQLRVEIIACAVARGVANLHVDQRKIERRDGFRPDNAILVVACLDDGGNQSARANAVGAHRDGVFLAIRPGDGSAHWSGILVAKVEDVTDFNATSRNLLAL